jgi:hypothetical protein
MTNKHIRAAWSFECVLPTGVKIKSWFYSDSEADAVKRITEYLGARLIKIKPIDNPLQELFTQKPIKSNPLFKSL